MFEKLDVLFEDNDFQASLVVKEDFDVIFDKNYLLNFIHEKGVLYGIDDDRVDNFIYLIKSRKIEVRAYPIAFGLKPKDGRDGEICIPSILEDEHRLEDSNIYLNVKIDFRYYIKEEPNLVEQNDIIGFYIPPDRGEPGINVKGEIIQPKNGKELNIKIGSKVTYSDNKFISQIKGALKFGLENDSVFINVEDVYFVDGDVNYSTGNIIFPGTVVVKGEVKPNFEISAEADIYATRVVCATLNAKGNILIKEGIIGDRLGNKSSHCNAGGIIKANYIQYSEVECSDRVIVNKYILHSAVYSEERIEVLGYPGRIIGGKAVSFSDTSCNIYGSKSGIYTRVICGTSYRVFLYYEKLLNEYQILAKKIKILSHYLGNLGKLENKLSESLETLNRKRILYKNKQVELIKNVDKLKGSMFKYVPVKIEAKQYIFPRVEININGFTKLNKKMKSKGYFILDKLKMDILFVDTY